MPSSAPSDDPDSRGSRAGDRRRALREAGPYVGLGTTLAATVLAGLGAGYWLDGQLGTRPWFLLAGGTLGVIAALVYFFRTVTDLWKPRKDPRR
ncbi:MAG: AtpZ/AtpI family protein [Acidobacteria bacterium]|nr:AtpZ/AtpI family protein [Acidobacteriota bacterium]